MSASGPFFIVGSPRSGTTLLRNMLDAHPRLAVPPRESHWVLGLAPRRVDRGRRRPRYWQPRRPLLRGRGEPVLEEILCRSPVADWGVPEDEVRQVVAERGPASYAELVDAVFAAYARHHGKGRWGDKTPGFARHIPSLERLFPRARYIHVVRDGREVAASLADIGWATSPVVGAFWWRKHVRAARRAGVRIGPHRFHELRLEDLVADPEGTLRLVAAALGEAYDPAMLDYAEAAADLPGNPIHHHVAEPPTAGLRDWRKGLSSRDQEAVAAACGPLLGELGYGGSRPPRTAAARARAARVRHLLGRAAGGRRP